MLHFLFSLLFVVVCLNSRSQTVSYSTANAHSHNDYEKDFPFWQAWKAGFGSIEADIFLHNGKLLVAHDSIQLEKGWTLDSLYLRPLAACIQSNGGTVYTDAGKTLQLMIDIKSDSVATLQHLVERVKAYPKLTATPTLKIVISGNRPDGEDFAAYPAWIRFDGDLRKTYTAQQMDRIEMLSGNFKHYSTWNGKGRIIEKERLVLQSLIEKAHQQGKKIRFWNAPDNLNTWYAFLLAGIDYLNTDHIAAIGSFFHHLPQRWYEHPTPHAPYQPKRRNDGAAKRVKNIILLIGDGTGLAQWQAAHTANRGLLNVFNMRFSGLSKTASFDSYITDSAPGATAFSAGKKTTNRAVGVDPAGKALRLLPEMLAEQRIKTGIITTGDLRDATPAAFYAHQPERSSHAPITNDLLQSPVQFVMGALPARITDSLKGLDSRFRFFASLAGLPAGIKTLFVVADPKAALPADSGRGDWASQALGQAINRLSDNAAGFLLVVEGAQVDHGGHANRLPYLVKELLDFDKVIGRAMEFADSNGETLVIVTGDHETGGLTLTGGDYDKGRTIGTFSTDDHTAIPVPVFAYGPGAQLFTGVYENTAVFEKILQALQQGKR